MEQVLGGACRADALQSGSQPGAWVGAVQEGQLRRAEPDALSPAGSQEAGVAAAAREVVRLGDDDGGPPTPSPQPTLLHAAGGQRCTVEARRLRVGGGTGKQAPAKNPLPGSLL